MITIHDEILFSGKDLRCTYKDAGSNLTVIIFNARTPILHPTNPVSFEKVPIMGNNVFCPLGINEVHIFPNKSNWYQTKEIDDIADIVKKRIKNTIYITYGSSMGAFAAINFSPLFQCDFIAFAPQATLCDPFPITKSWLPSKNAYPHFESAILEKKCLTSKGLLFVDMRYAIDAYHATHIKKNTQAILINIPFSSHETISAVNSILRVKKIIKNYLEGNFDIHIFKKQFFKEYIHSFYYIKHKYKNMDDDEISHILDSTNDNRFFWAYGGFLYDKRQYAEAYTYLSKALEYTKEPTFKQYISLYINLKRLNKYKEAVRFLENIPFDNYIKYGNLFLDYYRLKDQRKSDENLLKALSLHPNKIAYMKKLIMLFEAEYGLEGTSTQ